MEGDFIPIRWLKISSQHECYYWMDRTAKTIDGMQPLVSPA